MKKSVMKLAKNKYVFYLFVVLALINLLGYFGTRSWECIVMFAAVAYSTRCYAKNDTIAILVGLFVSNFVFSCNKMKESFVETMQEGADGGEKEEEEEEEEEEDKGEGKGGDGEAAAKQAADLVKKLGAGDGFAGLF